MGKQTEKMARSPSNTSMASLKGLGAPKTDSSPDEQDTANNLEYEVTLMYGRYSANLAEFAGREADRVKAEKDFMDDELSKELQPYTGRASRLLIKFIRPMWDKTFARLGEDWVFLFILGLAVANLTFLIDYIVLIFFKARMYLYQDLLANTHVSLQLFVWVALPTVLVIFSAAFCQWLAPSAAGSGIPEMKTILRGVILKEYLTAKTLLAKFVGLATVLGAGMPLGKEGPVMHMASIVSSMLMKLLEWIKGTVDNEAHSIDLLAAACTMGVAVCYAAPVGGVLFSIEVTAVYFAVRNYWRGFFAAAVGATFYRLMSVWLLDADTIHALYKVELNFAFPYDVLELLPFLCIGVLSGFAGSMFVYCHRRYVIFIRQNKVIKRITQKRRLLYPTFICIVISLMTFPDLLGKYMATTSTTKEQILDLFSNVTWTILPGDDISFEQKKILQNWVDLSYPNFHLSLFIFEVVNVFHIAIASTLPVPSGLLIPLFRVGAAFGRQIGELMVTLYPYGINPGFPIIPGAYAMVGAASFCAAVTHTISISVIVFELTGQITYVIPIMIGVLISNCISSLLQPSIYDSVIRIKKLPYLPDIITTNSDAYSIYAEDIMVRDVKYIWHGITYLQLKDIIKENIKLKCFPIVDKHDSMILLGSIPRVELVRIIVEQICTEKRLQEAKRRELAAVMRKFTDEEDSNDKRKDGDLSEDEMDSASNDSGGDDDSYMEKSESGVRSFFRSRSGSIAIFPFMKSDSKQQESAASKLKDLFPSPFKRESGRFSISHVHGGNRMAKGNSTNDLSTTDGSSLKTSTEDISSSSGTKSIEDAKFTKKKSKLDLWKSFGTHADKKERNTNTPFKKRVRLTRSNSLDAIHVAPNIKVDHTEIKTDDDDDIESQSTPSPPAAMKSILKRRNSLSLGVLASKRFTSHGEHASEDSHYQTVTVVDSKLRHAIERMKQLRIDTASSMEFKLSQLSLFKAKRKDAPKKDQLDLTPEERESWELSELSIHVDFSVCHIDPSPFQLVERTTLLKVHSLFSMLGINHAFVTTLGKLVGVVALKEVRHAIEGQVSDPQGRKSAVPQKAKLAKKLTGVSPQRLGTVPPLDDDPEAGIIIRRGSSASLPHVSNNVT